MDCFHFSFWMFAIPLFSVPFVVAFLRWYDEHISILPRKDRVSCGLSMLVLGLGVLLLFVR